MKGFNRSLPIALILTLGLLLGILGFAVWDKVPFTVERVAWSPQAQWIAAPETNYRFYARRTFNLPDTIQSGWLRLSADNSFVVYVNGRPVVRDRTVFNNALGLASRRNGDSQDFNDSIQYRTGSAINYLVGSSKHWKLTTYLDITSYLRPGKNVLALEIQKGQTNPRVVVEGVIYPVANSPQINLTTGASPWKTSILSENHQGLQWFDPDFPDENWFSAVAIGSVKEATYSRLSQNLFDRSLQGNWITGDESPQGELWLRGSWHISQTQLAHAFIRFAGDQEYALLINGMLVKRYTTGNSNQLHLYDVTKYLHPGINSLAVRLARPLEASGKNADGLLSFLLDGWVETKQGEIKNAIATDNTWMAFASPEKALAQRADQGQSAIISKSANPQEFRRTFEGDAYLLNYPDYLWHQSLWQLTGIAFALVWAWSLGRFWLGHQDSWWDSLGAGTALLFPGTLFLIGIGLLKHRYAEAETGLLFAQPESNALILLGFASIVLVTLLWSQIKDQGMLPNWSLWFLLGLFTCVGLGLAAGGRVIPVLLVCSSITTLTLISWWRKQQIINLLLPEGLPSLRQVWKTWGQWFLLVLIISIGFGLRVYQLGFIDLDTDENVSLDASRGILHTGAPAQTSGIWYTRGPFYQYLLALWLRIVGDSIVNARLLSALWGTATLVLVFLLARKVTGKAWIALLITAILAVDPFAIWYSRNIRFYAVLQFMSLLAFWSFFKGFIEQAGKLYQYIFFLTLTLTLLTQEVTISLLPCFLIGFLCFYQKFRWSRDWSMLLSSLEMLVIFGFNGIVFSIICLTPRVAISGTTGSFLQLRLFNITGLASRFFVGPDRIYTIYSCLFFLGFIYFMKRRDGKVIFLFSSVLINLISVTLTTYLLTERYTYPVYPLFILLAVYSGICIVTSLSKVLESILDSLLPLRAIALAFIVLLLLGNIEPARVLSGYQEAIVKRDTKLFEYIQTHRQPGDVVVSPSITFAAVNLGGLDYFLTGSGYLDAPYWHDGRLVDRVAGGVVVSNLDQLNHVLEKSQRVWLHVDDLKENRFDSEMIEYLVTLGKPVFDSFGSRLRLWQAEDGLLPRVPNQGKNLGAY
jgi:4-amino-4-deoxy-L-arabinose transferase-like glycosyltransferase